MAVYKRLESDGYKNWVRCSLALVETKPYLHKYVEERFYKFVNGQLRHSWSAMQFTDAELNHGAKYPFGRYAKYKNGTWIYDIEKDVYKCRPCEALFYKVLALHLQGPKHKTIGWSNCEDNGRNLHWDVAKVFMPLGNKSNNGPQDTDTKAMLQLMNNCKLFQNPKVGPDLEKLIEGRNKICHAPDNTISNQDSTDYFYHMKALFEKLSNDYEASYEAREEMRKGTRFIEEFENKQLSMSLQDSAQKALEEKRKALYTDIDDLLASYEPEKIKAFLRLIENIGVDIALWGKYKEDAERFQRIESRMKGLKQSFDRLKSEQSGIVKDMETLIEQHSRDFSNKAEQVISRLKDRIEAMVQTSTHVKKSSATLQLEQRQLKEGVIVILQQQQREFADCIQDVNSKLQDQTKKLVESSTNVKRSFAAIQFKQSQITKETKVALETQQSEFSVVIQEVISKTQDRTEKLVDVSTSIKESLLALKSNQTQLKGAAMNILEVQKRKFADVIQEVNSELQDRMDKFVTTSTDIKRSSIVLKLEQRHMKEKVKDLLKGQQEEFADHIKVVNDELKCHQERLTTNTRHIKSSSSALISTSKLLGSETKEMLVKMNRSQTTLDYFICSLRSRLRLRTKLLNLENCGLFLIMIIVHADVLRSFFGCVSRSSVKHVPFSIRIL